MKLTKPTSRLSKKDGKALLKAIKEEENAFIKAFSERRKNESNQG
jgi:hypothetical protein